ncbi:glycosyl transferase [Burkholderia territorii]|uniref:glycosyltransferase family 2 protein n=1 Tax=Burkholderia territorii TaxID=1503055 RepID=UPI000756D577|nr:glycosyltransferase family 2 protein [Burkholderia territorii]KUY98719.1 glycosyl transferase [Burkholderia territorii]KUZ22622.1 glycosyl transferase [Burkholderia territorii]
MTVTNASQGDAVEFSVSVVVYRPDEAQLRDTLRSLRDAIVAMRQYRPEVSARIYLIDNGGFGGDSASLVVLEDSGISCTVIAGHGNVGYGCGHNLAVARASSSFHLVLNPDVDIQRDALMCALEFIDVHPDVGLLAPRVTDGDKVVQYLCRRYPTVVDLFVRGFLPTRLRFPFNQRLARYEMRDLINDHDIVWDPPIVSGCFMLFRTDVLKKLGGFDPRYFLYFEDYDLSLRTHDVARVAYVPSVRVIHHGGGASRKGLAHIRMFAASAFKFYNRFGWRLW